MTLADWITLDIPWWVFVLWYVGAAFWPLTALAALLGLLYWRLRTRAALLLFAVPLAVWVVSAGVNLSPYVARLYQRAEIRSRQYTLTQPALIDDIRLPAGTVVTRSRENPNSAEAIDLKTPTVIAGIPVVGHVDVPGGRMMNDVTLARNATIDGVLCSPKGNVHLDFLGHLTECTVPYPVLVRGVPCDGTVNVEYRVQCTLAKDYSRLGYVWRASTVIRDGGDNVMFTVGPNPPSPNVLGSPLPQAAEVQFSRGKLLSINFGDRPIRYGKCVVGQILGDDGGYEAQCGDGTRLHLAKL
jgi:hypothetical protein